MQILATLPADGDVEAWADEVFEASAQPAAACLGSVIAGTSMTCAPSACSTSRPSTAPAAHAAAVRALADRVAVHVGHPSR